MVFPTSFASAVLLLLLSFLCFSIWPNLYKRSERRWRFEFFSLDFSLGAILLALLTAYTLGTLGPEMSFTDRMLIAGRAASVWVIGGGAVFALGNMLLLVSITLLGMAPAFAASFGTALGVTAAIYIGHSHPLLLSGVAVCLLLCVVFGLMAGRIVSQPVKQPVARSQRAGPVAAMSLAILSGLALGGLQYVLKGTADPEFGIGPYASTLMLAIGILISTPALNFFFTNIRLTANPISVKLYVQGGLKRHVPGFISGVIWALGTLAVLAALSTPAADEAPSALLIFVFPVSSVVVCILLGLFRWKEFPASRPRTWLFLSIVSFAAGCAFFGSGLAK